MAGSVIFQDLKEAEAHLTVFFRQEVFKNFFGSLYRTVRAQIPKSVILGKGDKLIGISDADGQYLLYVARNADGYYIRFRNGEDIPFEGAYFNQIYGAVKTAAEDCSPSPKPYPVKYPQPARTQVIVPDSAPRTKISISESGNVIDNETGEILSLDERLNTLGYYMDKLAVKKAEFAAENAELTDIVDKLKAGIKQDFLSRQEGITYGRVNVSYIKPKPGWDNERLEQYAETHPEINDFRKSGNPVIAIRLLKEKTQG